MTLGYGAPEIVARGPRPPGIGQKNMEGYRDALFTEVIPAVEQASRVDARRERRAIAGLSMGGAESLLTERSVPHRSLHTRRNTERTSAIRACGGGRI